MDDRINFEQWRRNILKKDWLTENRKKTKKKQKKTKRKKWGKKEMGNPTVGIVQSNDKKSTWPGGQFSKNVSGS